jgi:hypothetical protein
VRGICINDETADDDMLMLTQPGVTESVTRPTLMPPPYPLPLECDDVVDTGKKPGLFTTAAALAIVAGMCALVGSGIKAVSALS